MRARQEALFPELKQGWYHGPLTGSVLTGTNADLIHAIAPIYLDGRTVLDITYGRGGWWRRYTPDTLAHHDLATDGVDFRALPEADNSWNVVCYDPPYIPAGGAETTTAPDFQDRFGLRCGRSQADLAALILDGLTEASRVASEAVLLKCTDYVNGGAFTPMSYRIAAAAETIGLSLWDEIIHHSGSGPGGHNISRQMRTRREHSKLLVFGGTP